MEGIAEQKQQEEKKHIAIDEKVNYDDDNNGDVFSKYRRADGTEVTSTVIGDVKPWQNHSFLVPHEPFRRNLIEVSYLLRKIKTKQGEQQRWKVFNFFNWYIGRFYPNVMAHHDVEEHIMFPFVKTRMPLPDRTTSDHKKLVELMNTIKDMHRLFVDEAARKTEQGFEDLVKQLILNWDELRDHTLPHLAEEEEISLELPKYFKEEEYDKQVDKILSTQSVSAVSKELPGIIIALRKWGGEELAENFLKKVPAPVRFLNNKFWTPAFMKYEREALESLRSDTEKIIGPESSYSACTIL